MRHQPIHRIAVLLAALGLTVMTAACGDDTPTVTATTTSPAAAFPVTLTGPKGPVTIEKRPEKIVSLSPTATEMLFAIGADAQVGAVDDKSNYPATAPKTDLSGYQPNIEAIAARRPDLVVASGDTGGLADGLSKLKIPTLIQPVATTLADSYAQIEALGKATGHRAEATKVVAGIKGDIAELVASVPTRTAALTYYHELDPLLYSVTSKTFIGQLYTMAGLTNIADAADKAGSGYPQLSAEAIFEADPDFIFLADAKTGGQSAETVSKRPGWSKLSAVKTGKVIPLDDDIASRWGPRVVEMLRAIVESTTAKAKAPAA